MPSKKRSRSESVAVLAEEGRRKKVDLKTGFTYKIVSPNPSDTVQILSALKTAVIIDPMVQEHKEEMKGDFSNRLSRSIEREMPFENEPQPSNHASPVEYDSCSSPRSDEGTSINETPKTPVASPLQVERAKLRDFVFNGYLTPIRGTMFGKPRAKAHRERIADNIDRNFL